MYDVDGRTYNESSYKSYFNSNGDVTLEIGEVSGNTRVTTMKYDDYGRISEILEYNESSIEPRIILTRYEYSDHQIIKHEERTYVGNEGYTSSDSDETILTLDDNGRVVKRVTYYDGSTSTAKYFYTYDEKGNLIYNESWNYPEGGITSWSKLSYTYNDRNLVTKEQIESNYIGQGGDYEYEYEYDENGNVIKRTSWRGTDYYTYAPIPQGGSKSSFEDVGATEYYNMPVIWASDTGITKGTSDTTFSPNQSCTRGQLVTFLWRAAGSPEPETSENPFTDVAAGSYYEKAVLWAVENNITNGVDVGLFAPDRTCTRAQIVTFIYRAAREPDIEVQSESFVDVAADAYYAKAVAWAVANDITNGVDVGLFAPDRTCTRGQGVTFLYRGIGLY